MSSQTLPAHGGLAGVRRAIGRALAAVPRWLLIMLAVLLVAAIVASVMLTRSSTTEQVVTEPVVRQTLVQSVTASGTVNAQNSVTVGSQVSGTISQLYVDFNSKVKEGQVLARIDPSNFQAQLSRDQANLAQAQAQAGQAAANASGAGSGVSVAQANAVAQAAAANAAKTNIAKAQAALTLAQQQYNRDAALLSQGYMPQSTVDTDRAAVAQDEAAVAQAQAAYAQAQAQAQASQSTISQSGSTAQAQAASADAAQAAVQAARAAVQTDELNLQHTVITSPVNGTVVSRAVSVGQTVAASLQAPTLFTIAQDLSKMQVDINVGEPDIGGIKRGNTVDFTVLAYPTTTFHGVVDQVRINPQTVNNVVTYDVVVHVNNPDGKLLPGMTANATVNVASAPNALVVPISALRVRPSTSLRSAQGDSGGVQRGRASGNAQQGASAASPWGGPSGTTGTVATGQRASLMVQRNGTLERVRVQVGLITATQAAVTPIDGSTLSEGDKVVTAFTGGGRPSTSRSSNAALRMTGGATRGVTRGIH